MINFFKRSFYLLILLTPCLSFGWYDTGHMVIAKIAEDRLDTEVQQEINSLLSTTQNGTSFIESACFADDFSNQIPTLFRIHLEPKIYDPQGILPEDKKALLDSLNGERALTSMLTECMQLLKNKSASNDNRAFALRWIIHLVGDVHQPLHSTTLYNHDFPEGDRFGTRYMTWLDPDGNKKLQLHSVWDGAGDERIIEWLKRPLSRESFRKIEDLADEITHAYPESSMTDVVTVDYSQWLNETYQVGVTDVYNGIEPETMLSSEYIDRMRQVCHRQLALAGYRMASVLNQSLGKE